MDFYNPDMIFAVGYRVRSHRGIQFRQWATKHLAEYVVKGFVLDDERLKESGGGGANTDTRSVYPGRDYWLHMFGPGTLCARGVIRVRRLLVLLLLALAVPASAFPPLPAKLSGTVTINGDPAPAGTVITARIGDRDCGSLTLATAGVFGGEGFFDDRLATIHGERGCAKIPRTGPIRPCASGRSRHARSARTHC